MNTKPLGERFWKRVEKTSGCWLWPDTKGKRYGQISRNGKMEAAHRVSYELHFGPIPDGQFVLHKCDNGFCVRPDHLFLGTQQDNVDDCVAKNRRNNGHLSRAKLTREQVVECREAYVAGARIYLLARRFGVDHSTMWQAVKGKTWTTTPL